MKKDLDKLFSKSIETYYFLLLIVVIIKLLGGNYFEIVYTNKAINTINNFIMYWKLENVWYAITLYIYAVVIIGITTNDNSKRLKLYCLKCLPFFIFMQILKTKINMPNIFAFIDLLYLLLFSIIYYKFFKKEKTNRIVFKNYFTLILVTWVFQWFSMIIRNIKITNENNFITYFVLNLDYLILYIIMFKYYFMKGVIDLWVEVVSSGSQKLISLKGSLKDLLENSQNKKPKSKEEKITNAIYLPLYILWNLFTMLIIILIAFLNDAFIEAIFITVAFWVNKFAFGKPFHFKSVAVCFAFSSVTYYVLTRITFKTETSFFIPIFLGVALSYITSHFIKKNTKLYKGMVEEEFYDVVKQVEDDKLTIKMLKEYYCDRQKDSYISMQNGYSIDSVRKKRQNVNRKLRSLQ